jgi:hypothetical protein
LEHKKAPEFGRVPLKGAGIASYFFPRLITSKATMAKLTTMITIESFS